MNRVAIAFLTKDRVALTEQTLTPLLQPDKFDLHWVDGSSPDGETFMQSCLPRHATPHTNIRGGADAAIVYALSTLLAGGNVYRGELGSFIAPYTHVGLCENDVLLDPDWFEATMALFDNREGLHVGAASPRCYDDRILVQRDGYAVMHNLGAGVVIFTREAARLILDSYRTTFSTENRNLFGQLSGVDIGPYWAFRGDARWLTADWGFDAMLARTGLASVSLTPAKCRMIGQEPPLEQQGLKLVTEPVDALRNDAAFERYRDNLKLLWSGVSTTGLWPALYQDAGNQMFFPHQIRLIDASVDPAWKVKWCQGFGPFSFQAGEPNASILFNVAGPCDILVSGGAGGARVAVFDSHSGYSCEPSLSPEGTHTQVMSLPVPGGPVRRDVSLTAIDPGAVFYGIRTHTPQLLSGSPFNHANLPPV